MLNATSLIKASWIAVEVGRERAERVLVVETYIAVSPLEPNFDQAQYDKVLGCVRNVLSRHKDIDRASILSMHRGLRLHRPVPRPARRTRASRRLIARTAPRNIASPVRVEDATWRSR